VIVELSNEFASYIRVLLNKRLDAIPGRSSVIDNRLPKHKFKLLVSPNLMLKANGVAIYPDDPNDKATN
jgi:hypothetical protein